MVSSITIPSELSKNRQEHRFPIGPMAQSIFREIWVDRGWNNPPPAEKLPNTYRTDYLFPARKTWRGAGTVYNAWNKDKPKLDARSGVTDWVIHDLRRTLSSNWA